MANIKTINYNGVTYQIKANEAISAQSATEASSADQLEQDRLIDGVLFNGQYDVSHYAICSTSGNLQDKEINSGNFSSFSNFFLSSGARLTIKFSNPNSANNPRIKLGANDLNPKPIYYGASPIEADAILAGQVLDLVYDASANNNNGAWLVVGGITESEGITYSEATQSDAGLMSANDKFKLDHMLVSEVEASSPLSEENVSGVVTISHNATPVNHSGTTYGIQSNATPSFGGTFNSVEVEVDAYGHVLGLNHHTVKIPDTEASRTTAGLMSSTDWNKLQEKITIGSLELGLGDEITAAELKEELNLSSAMSFIGITSTTMSDGLTTNPIVINNTNVTAVKGDVVIDASSAREYVWVPAIGQTAAHWEELGPDGSYALANHTHDVAATNRAGFMSAADWNKLRDIENDAQVNIIEGVKLNNVLLNPDENKRVNIDIPTNWGASSSVAGRVGLVPAPAIADKDSFLRGDGTWAVPENTEYDNATNEDAGLMSAVDKDKLDHIAPEATKTIIHVSSPIVSTDETGDVTLSHATSGVTQGTYGIANSNQTPAFGGTVSIPRFEVNATGHVTSAASYTLTIPNTVATRATSGLMHHDDKTKLDLIPDPTSLGTVTQINPGAGIVFTNGTSVSQQNITETGTIKVALQSETPYSVASLATPTPSSNDRVYPIGLDNLSHLSVYVPWEHYGLVSTSGPGLMSVADFTKLKNVAEEAKFVSFTRTLNTGTKIGTLTINEDSYDLYSETNVWNPMGPATNVNGTAGYVAAPQVGDQFKYWAGNGTWRGEPTNSGELGLILYADKVKLSTLTGEETKNIISADSNTPISVTRNENSGTDTISHDASGVTAGTYGVTATTTLTPSFGDSISVPGFEVDATGHITSAGAHNITIPDADARKVNNVTVHGLMSVVDKDKLDDIAPYANNFTINATNGTPISINTTTSSSVTTATITHADSGVINGTYGSTNSNNAKLIDYSDNATAYSLTIPGVSVNTTGHVTEGFNKLFTIPTATTNHDGFLTSADKTKLDNMHVYNITPTTPIVITDDNAGGYTISHANSNVTPNNYGDSTNQTPTFGGNIKGLYVNVNATGHITSISEHNITIPDSIATQSAKGLMSEQDKFKLDEFEPAWRYATLDYVNDALSGLDPMVFKGVVNSYSELPQNTNPNGAHYDGDLASGWTYRIGTAGTYGTYSLATGDLIIKTDSGWVGISTNSDGALFKAPNNFTNNDMLLADGTIGRVKSVPVNPQVVIIPGDDSNAPAISFSIGAPSGNNNDQSTKFTATAEGLTIATAGGNNEPAIYGVTKLSSVSSAIEEGVAATPKGVWAAINTLDVSNNANDTNHITGFDAGKTLATLTETNGLISATFQPIEILTTQINVGNTNPPLQMNQGGTGMISILPNFVLYSDGTYISPSWHYVDSNHLLIQENFDSLAAPLWDSVEEEALYNFGVDGTSYLNGATIISTSLTGVAASANDPFIIETDTALGLNISNTSGDINLIATVEIDENSPTTPTLSSINFETNDATKLTHTIGNNLYYIPSINMTSQQTGNYPLISTTTDNVYTLNTAVTLNGADVTIGETDTIGNLTVGLSVTSPEFVGDLTGNADTATAADISTTANSVAFYTNTTGTFGYKASADGALYATSADGALQWGTLPVQQGGTGMTSTSTNNAVVIGNSSNPSGAMQTVQTKSGAFFATSANGKPEFNTLPVAQGGTGAIAATGARKNLGVGNARVYYGSCESLADAAIKQVNISDEYTAVTAGDIVFVKFSYANTAAVVNLQLKVKNTNALPIKCIYNDSIRNLLSPGQLQASVYMFTYDGTNWVVNLDYNSTVNNEVRYASPIKAANGITANRVIVGTNSGYLEAASGVSFDIRYPVLFAAAAINSNATGVLNYSVFERADLSYSSSWSGTAHSPTYLVGTLQGNIFTIDEDVFTTTVPATKDNKVYIYIGLTYNGTNNSTSTISFHCENQMFTYSNGAFVPTAAGSGELAAPVEVIFTLHPSDYAGVIGENEAQWNGNTITIYNENVTDNSLQIVTVPEYEYESGVYLSSTEAGILGGAMLIDDGQSGPVGSSLGYFRLRALGEVPTATTHIKVIFKYTTDDTLESIESAAASASDARASVNQIGAKALMARKSVTFSSVLPDNGNTVYPYKYEVSINGVAPNDWVDGAGITDQDWAIESMTNKVVLHFSREITTLTTVNIYWCSCFDLDNA